MNAFNPGSRNDAFKRGAFGASAFTEPPEEPSGGTPFTADNAIYKADNANLTADQTEIA